MALSRGGNDVVVSRRRLICGAGLLAGGVGLVAFPAAAQTKVSKAIANYQSSPKGAARCDGCTQWQGPSSCKVVQGVISPSGWCQLYAPKPKS